MSNRNMGRAGASLCQLAFFAFGVALCAPTAALATHPLVTDDAGTQGQGHFQLEVNGQYDHDQEEGVTRKGGQVAAALTYGITDAVDLAVSAPFLWSRQTSDDGASVNSSESGVSDTTVDIKVRFFEKDGLSFAVKPGLNFPTGDNDKGLGTGKTGYHLFFIGTKEAGPWTFLANLGYIRNETKSDFEEENLWHVSAGATYALDKQWKLVANTGAQRNPDKEGHNDPVFALAGVVYSPTEKIDLDLGVKTGLTSSETDWSLLAGMTFKF